MSGVRWWVAAAVMAWPQSFVVAQVPAKPPVDRALGQGTPTERPAIPTDRRPGRVLKLRLRDCFRLGDERNLDLRLARINELLSHEDINLADAFFEPEFFMTAEWRNSKSPPRNAFQPSTRSTIYSGSVGIRKRVVTGGSLELAFSPQYIDQRVNSSFAFPTTFFSGDVTFTLSQPLLRGAWIDYNLSDYEAAKARTLADREDHARTRQTVLDDIVVAYYNLVFTREDYVVRAESLELAREQLNNTEQKIKLGELAPRDRVADQAEVSKKEEELITAENAILDAEDALRRLILAFDEENSWNLVLIPVAGLGAGDPILEAPRLEVAYAQARQSRPDLAARKHRVEAARRDVLKAKRDLLPGLDLTASYSAAGQRDSADDLTGDIFDREFPTYSVRLALSLPIGNLAAKSTWHKALLRVESAERQLHILSVDVERDVRVAVRALQTAQKSIVAARESVRLAASELDSVRIKLGLGSETQFVVQQRNQDLQDARSRLLRARLDYRVSWFHLLAVQGRLAPDSKLPETSREESKK